MTPPPAPEWPGVLAQWHLEPVALAVVGVVAIAYGHGYRSASTTGSDRRALLFASGLGIVVVALMSPVGTYADALLSVHMVQHLLLVLVAAPLLVAARPLPTLLASLPDPTAAEILGLGETRLGRLAGHPLVAWVLFAAMGWAVHFSPLFDLALKSPPVHAGEHALFLGAGLLFWRPVLGERALSYPLRLLYLALAMPQNTFLALAISSAGEPLYETYGRLGRTWGPTLLADQRQAGGLM
ncbi:MAG: cytochrome c oxidase assembly protein, partial [Actinobacteria bacterium]|nr:cytochrome c oxidase assembly protein [Actinomycetota bacterium]